MTKEAVPTNVQPSSHKPEQPNTNAHVPNRLGTVVEEEKERSSCETPSVEGHTLDTEAVKDALIKYKSLGSEDNPPSKYRQYSDDIMEDCADEPEKDSTDSKNTDKEDSAAHKTETLKEKTSSDLPEKIKDLQSNTGKAAKNVTNGDRDQRQVDNPVKTPAYRTRCMYVKHVFCLPKRHERSDIRRLMIL